MAKSMESKLKEGDVAPDFKAATNTGEEVSLVGLKGKHVVLYFYPKDDTPGCTKEACAFRDRFADFKKKGVVVLGVSIDPVKAHQKFIDKYKLPFPLLSDENKSIVNAYGVWGEKTFMRTSGNRSFSRYNAKFLASFGSVFFTECAITRN